MDDLLFFSIIISYFMSSLSHSSIKNHCLTPLCNNYTKHNIKFLFSNNNYYFLFIYFNCSVHFVLFNNSQKNPGVYITIESVTLNRTEIKNRLVHCTK